MYNSLEAPFLSVSESFGDRLIALLLGAVALWLVRWTPDRAVWFEPWLGSLRCVLRQDTLPLVV